MTRARAEALARLGRRAFRRPLTEAEHVRFVGVAEAVADGDGYRGLRFATAALLQSPHFLYRVELAEQSDRSARGRRRYDGYEMATRLAFLLWNGPPDDALLDAAGAGELDDVVGLTRCVEAMLDDPRAGEGRRRIFAELLRTDAIPSLVKDPDTFPVLSPTVLAAMRDQLELTAAHAAEQGGVASIYTTRTVFVNAELAALQGIDAGPGVVLDHTLVEVTLPAADPRGGILTLPGFLATNAYPGRTSPALRGLFVRKNLLCQEIPPLPPGLDTTLPVGAGSELVTARELLARHQRDPSCAACHAHMDPIGLGLERFDAIGRYRETENELVIDPSGSLDGYAFRDAVGLGAIVARHPAMPKCFARSVIGQALGQIPGDRQAPHVDPVVEELVRSRLELDALLVALATSDLFRFVEDR